MLVNNEIEKIINEEFSQILIRNILGFIQNSKLESPVFIILKNDEHQARIEIKRIQDILRRKIIQGDNINITRGDVWSGVWEFNNSAKLMVGICDDIDDVDCDDFQSKYDYIYFDHRIEI